MNFIFKTLATLTTCLTMSVASATQQDLDFALKYSQDKKLASSNQWQSLLHVDKRLFSSSPTIRDTKFFIYDDSNWSPEYELRATLKALFSDPQKQCRFPARTLWLKHSIPNLVLPKIECSEYQDFKSSFQSQSVSVIYASGYLENPASMYGHIFLKFAQNNGQSELLDNTFSYGAHSDDGDNKLVYIYKGMTGGYRGIFSNQQFHHQSLRYNESELRDLWEYKLALSPEQIELLLAHLWELKQTEITYFFFRENCAYQLAMLLNTVIDDPILPPNKTWVMPFDVVMTLNEEPTKSWISEVIYHSSRQQDLHSHYAQLSSDEKEALESIIEENTIKTKPILDSLEEPNRKKVIDTLYDYYAFLSIKNDGLTDTQKQKRTIALTERFSLPVGQSDWNEQEHTPPHKGQHTALLQLAPFYNSTIGAGMSYRFRASYYDLLTDNAAKIPFSELSAFDLTLTQAESSQALNVHSFQLINIANLNASRTGLPEDHSAAWAFNIGYEPKNLSCTSCSNAYMGGFYGSSFSFSEQAASYISIAEKIQFPDHSPIQFELGPEIGGVWNITPNWATSLKARRLFNLNYLAEYEDYVSWEQRFLNNPNYDVRTSVKFDGRDYEYAIQLSKYW